LRGDLGHLLRRLGRRRLLEHVLDHRNDRLGREARGIDLAHALDSASGLELEKLKIAAAEGGRRLPTTKVFSSAIFMGVRTAGEGDENPRLSVRAYFSTC
jgi:hypothetical protein